MDEGPIYFFKPDHPEFGFLCQWYPSKFTNEDRTQLFKNAEQYMMYRKALTFSDAKTAAEILLTGDPKKCKHLGRQVAGFRDQVWDAVKLQIVEEGSYLKFTRGGQDLRDRLLATGERELVEAARLDRVWGVGFSADVLRMGNVDRELWGENLLGKALMAARKRIRDEEEEEKLRVDGEDRRDLKTRSDAPVRKPW